MEDYVKAALTKGLHKITFLEHLEVKILTHNRTWLTTDKIDEYFRRGRLLKKKYGNCIKIFLGVEIGYNPEELEAINLLLNEYPWENIGLSYHFYFFDGRHFNMMSRNQKHLTVLEKIGLDNIADHYFTTLINALDHITCDKICHIDAVLRHIPTFKLTGRHQLLVDTLLARMKKKRIALEINTSGFAIGNQPYPCAQITKKALDLDLPLVIGSDAHHPEQVGRFFDHLPNWLHYAASLP